MRRVMWLAGCALAVALLVPAVGSAQGRGEKAKPGGRAPEQRSERAVEHGNPQWEEDATRSRERAEEVRQTQEGETRQDAERARKGEPPEQAEGFWSRTRRFFGFGRSAEKQSEVAAERERASEHRPEPE